MEEYEIERYKPLMKRYEEANLIRFGSPDQFQFRQNQLLKQLAEFILAPFSKWEAEQNAKRFQEGNGGKDCN